MDPVIGCFELCSQCLGDTWSLAVSVWVWVCVSWFNIGKKHESGGKQGLWSQRNPWAKPIL